MGYIFPLISFNVSALRVNLWTGFYRKKSQCFSIQCWWFQTVDEFLGSFVFNVRRNILYSVELWDLSLIDCFGGLCSVGRSIVMLKNNIWLFRFRKQLFNCGKQAFLQYYPVFQSINWLFTVKPLPLQQLPYLGTHNTVYCRSPPALSIQVPFMSLIACYWWAVSVTYCKGEWKGVGTQMHNVVKKVI